MMMADAAVALWHSRALADVPHGFAGRRGGVSTGALASLNCGLGSGEADSIVTANRARAKDAVLPGAALVGLYQVHGRDCVRVNAAWSDADRPQADALVSDRPGIVLGILTADCAPVLLADVAAGVVGAAHAGWKGALAGVTDACLDNMIALGADVGRIRAAVGPCIALATYEVDRSLFDAFISVDPANEAFFRDGQRADRWQFDLEAYVVARLAAAGVGTVDCLGLDTYARADDFYSFRRATHRSEPTYGRQMSMIGIEQPA